MALPGFYQTYEATDKAQTERARISDKLKDIFEEGKRPHYYIDNTYSDVGRTFDTLVIVNNSTVTYVNVLGGDGATALALPAGDIIYGVFNDEDIVVGAGGLVRAYLASDSKVR